MKLLQTSYGYDIYELSRSESFMRGRNNRQFVAFVARENFDTVGAPEIETESFAEVLNYCSEYRINDNAQKQEAPIDKTSNLQFATAFHRHHSGRSDTPWKSGAQTPSSSGP